MMLRQSFRAKIWTGWHDPCVRRVSLLHYMLNFTLSRTSRSSAVRTTIPKIPVHFTNMKGENS
jgi:hypothetical protein